MARRSTVSHRWVSVTTGLRITACGASRGGPSRQSLSPVCLGWLARRAGDLDGAEAAYRRTLVLWPTSDEALNNLGNLLAMQGRFDDALATFQKANEADPRNAAAFFETSPVHTRLFDYSAASDAVARASALDFEMVKTYQAGSGESGDLPLVDRMDKTTRHSGGRSSTPLRTRSLRRCRSHGEA